MNKELKKKMRDILLERYGVDIDEAVCRFSTQNYAFIFSERPYMIRVSISPKKSRKEILSELMWVDDLKPFKQTICEPNESLNGILLEEFEIDGVLYRASMFRTARGNIKLTTEMKPMFFICVGDLLGTIHHVSTNERELGIQYGRKRMKDTFEELKNRVAINMPPEIEKRIQAIQEEVNNLPEELGRYGICHGDFHINNFFVEENNIWLFDFDGCTYAHYLYDVASFVQACFLMGYKAGEDCRKVLYEDILPYFKMGYELNKKCDEHYWEQLELFISYRVAMAYMSLLEIDQCGVVDNLEQIKQFLGYIISQDNVLDAMTAAAKKRGDSNEK